MYPTKSQKELLSKHFGCSRFVYNYFLERRIKIYKETKKNIHYYDDAKFLTILKQELKWLQEVSIDSLQQKLIDLQNSYNCFFKTIKKQSTLNCKFPKFKTKNSKQSFRCSDKVKIKNNKIYISKFRDGIKFKSKDRIGYRVKNCTITLDKSGNYFVSICTEKEIQKLTRNDNYIGIDLNVKQIVCSNGQKFDNPLPETQLQKELCKLSKSVGRKKLRSKNREKSQIKLNKLRQYCINVREDFLHKLSKKIINENQVIIVEDLSIIDMIKKPKKENKRRFLSKLRTKLIKDSYFSSFLNKLEYKSGIYGRDFIKIDRFYPSSKICSNCGEKYEDLKDEKNWQCKNCKVSHNRDENASINILREGMRIKTLGTSEIAYCPNIRLINEQLVG